MYKDKKSEFQRIKGKKNQLLYLLKLRGEKGMTNIEMSKVATRYGGILGVLYKEGYEIDVKSVDDKGVYRYTLISCPEKPLDRPKAKDVLKEYIDFNYGEVDADTLFDIMDELGITLKFKANTYKIANKQDI